MQFRLQCLRFWQLSLWEVFCIYWQLELFLKEQVALQEAHLSATWGTCRQQAGWHVAQAGLLVWSAMQESDFYGREVLQRTPQNCGVEVPA